MASSDRIAVDLLDGRFYAGDPRLAYSWMRAHEPVYADETNGVWGAASYAAVMAASRDPLTFSSAGGIRPDSPPLPMMIDMDDPAHSKRRKLVSRGFTPRRVRESETRIRSICDALIDTVRSRRRCDFVRDLAAPLPMIVIGDMLGVLPEDRESLLQWSDDMVSALGSDQEEEGMVKAATAFEEYDSYARAVIRARRSAPRDDLMSVLVHADVDGDRLDEDEIVHESLLILVGGDETTRHVLSGGMEQLLRHPEQMERLANNRRAIPVAVEEMLRWVSPIKNMCRVTTREVRLYGASIPAGRKVMLLYEAANFDESAFVEPERFDAFRQPNDHVAFGFGTHFCLGNSLARLELRVFFEQLLSRLVDLELEAGGPLPRRAANFISGIESMPIRFGPARKVRH